MSDGWVKQHRKVMDSAVWPNDALYKTFMWCVMKASHKPTSVGFDTGGSTDIVKLDRGQFVFGRKTAAKELKHKPSSVWKRIKKLELIGKIALKSNNRYSIITVINYSLYQSVETSGELASDKRVTTEGQASDTNKNVRIKEGKNKTPSAGNPQGHTCHKPSQPKPSTTADQIYDAYPRKVGRKAAIVKINVAIKDVAKRADIDDPSGWLLKQVQQYANSPKLKETELQYIPHPATWFNQARYDDEPSAWGITGQQATTAADLADLTPAQRLEHHIIANQSTYIDGVLVGDQTLKPDDDGLAVNGVLEFPNKRIAKLLS